MLLSELHAVNNPSDDSDDIHIKESSEDGMLPIADQRGALTLFYVESIYCSSSLEPPDIGENCMDKTNDSHSHEESPEFPPLGHAFLGFLGAFVHPPK